jgi:5'-3' exonuclease
MNVLIDGDIVIYSCGFAVETRIYEVDGIPFLNKADAREYCNTFRIPHDDIEESVEVEPVEHALHNAKSLLERIVNATRATTKTIYLTGEHNFREQLDSEYKANRDPNNKPMHYDALRSFLIDIHGATVINGMEADDAMGMHQCSAIEPTIIASIDKDLNMIPGKHYNWRKDKLYDVTEEEAMKFFYLQLLMGDRVDNIKGVPGIGPKKAERAVGHLTDEQDMYNVCTSLYADYYGVGHEEIMHTNAQLLWIRRDDNGWRKPDDAPLVEKVKMEIRGRESVEKRKEEA